VIEWLAAQPWSTGAVGMYGTSYSGFNSLQVAAERPPALKAIVAIYATDDRYTDDVHYVGGALRLLDLVDYPLYMVALNALPPVPALAGPGWRERWRERVEGLEPWLLRWLQEQVDGPYWRHGSLRPAYERIVCPTMIVAGWADGYRNATFRVLEGLRAPSRLLLGPWSHMATDSSVPGPRVDLVPEMVRWWDRWLRGRRNGVDGQAPVTVFVRHATRPAPDLAEVAGVWRDEPAWPPERAAELALPLGTGRDHLDVRPDVGAAAWIDCAGHLPFGQPDDQRADDAWSLTFDWPLDREVEVLGHPRLQVGVAASAPVAFLSAKLCDVFPDGTSALVARGFLNLTHRRSHAEPEPLEPGETERVELELHATSWVFPTGHRLRLSLAGADWPNAVPPPAPVVLTVERDGSVLTLPVLRGPSPSPPPTLPPPTGGSSLGSIHRGTPSGPDRPGGPAGVPRPDPSGRTPAHPPGRVAGGAGRARPDHRGGDPAWRADRAGRRHGGDRAVRRHGRDRSRPARAHLGDRCGRLPGRVAGGDRRHHRPAGPARRRRRLRGPGRPGGPRGRRAPLEPVVAAPHPSPARLNSGLTDRSTLRMIGQCGAVPSRPGRVSGSACRAEPYVQRCGLRAAPGGHAVTSKPDTRPGLRWRPWQRCWPRRSPPGRWDPRSPPRRPRS